MLLTINLNHSTSATSQVGKVDPVPASSWDAIQLHSILNAGHLAYLRDD